MSPKIIKNKKINKLYDYISNDLKRKVTIILDPENEYRFVGESAEFSFASDPSTWEIPEKYKKFISELSRNKDLTIEEKIITMYDKLCHDYTYDDNVLSYVKKNDDETFSLTDYYGRKVNDEWKKNREKHNKRNCFEISRVLAKSINEILKLSGMQHNYNVFIIWDEAVTHYWVGLVGEKCYATLDIDDFTQIKDLTRLKTNLTLDGIKIYEDADGKLKSVVNAFNNGRGPSASKAIETKYKQRPGKSNDGDDYTENDDLDFIKFAIEILEKEYDLDSQGIYEYIKEIVDTRLGPKTRKKIWTEVPSKPGNGKIYTRGLIIYLNGKRYLIDVTQKDPKSKFREISEQEESKLIPYSKLVRNWDNKEDQYDGR